LEYDNGFITLLTIWIW